MRFQSLMYLARQKTPFPELDPVEERVVSVLAAKWYEGSKMTVLEVIRTFEEFSISTMHKRLRSLRNKGVIALAFDQADARLRIIVPTRLTLDHFSHAGELLKKALK